MATDLGKDMAADAREWEGSRMALLVVMVKLSKALTHKQELLGELGAHLVAAGGGCSSRLTQEQLAKGESIRELNSYIEFLRAQLGGTAHHTLLPSLGRKSTLQAMLAHQCSEHTEQLMVELTGGAVLAGNSHLWEVVSSLVKLLLVIQAIESTGEHAQDYRSLLTESIARARVGLSQMNRHHFDGVEQMLRGIERMLLAVRGGTHHHQH